MNKFQVGDRVEKTMGVRLTGTVTEPFYYKDSTDGTYSPPNDNYVPVEWDDGTKGYCAEGHMDYEYF